MSFPAYCVTKDKVRQSCLFMEGAKAELDAIDMYETMQDLLGCSARVENSDPYVIDMCMQIEHIKAEELEHHAEFLSLLGKVGRGNYLKVLKGDKSADSLFK